MRPLAVAAGMLLAVGAGFLAGRGQAPVEQKAPSRPDAEAAALRARLALAEQKLARQAAQFEQQAVRHVERAVRAAGHVPQPARRETAKAEEQETFPLDRKLTQVRELVAAIEGMTSKRELYRQDVLDFVQARLVRELVASPESLAWALDRFRAAPTSPVGQQLAIALGLVKDPAVETAARELAKNGGTVEAQAAGLELLTRLDIASPETDALLLELLRGESPELLGGALHALRPRVAGPRQTREAVQAIAPLVRHVDVEVRRRAVIALAGWAGEAEALDPVLAALRDASPLVRAGAAFALSRARLQPEGSREALAARVADAREDWTVREQAWYSLGRLPLDAQSHAVYERFRAQWEAAGEARQAAEQPETH